MTRYPTTTNPRNRAPERLALVLSVVFGALLLSAAPALCSASFHFTNAEILGNADVIVDGDCRVQLPVRVSTPAGFQVVLVGFDDAPGCLDAALFAAEAMEFGSVPCVEVRGVLFQNANGALIPLGLDISKQR